MSSWKNFTSDKFRKKMLVTGVILLVLVLIAFSLFLNEIEKRQGYVLQDILLKNIPSYNLSIPIFTIIWLCSIISIWQMIKNPKFFLLFLWSYLLLCVSRIVTIGLVKLNPPIGIVELADPITNIFYGGKFLTKDLFYSGHTATVFLMYLVTEKKILKLLFGISSILVGIMVLIQHVHYTIDVVAAPFFAFTVYCLAKKITKI